MYSDATTAQASLATPELATPELASPDLVSLAPTDAGQSGGEKQKTKDPEGKTGGLVSDKTASGSLASTTLAEPARTIPPAVVPARQAVHLSSRLRELLRELHLPTIRACYEETSRTAEREGLSYERFLLELLEREQEERWNNRIERLLRESRLPLEKNLATFEQGRLTLRLRQQLRSLLEGAFLDGRENVLAFGNPGSGKTHLLCALSQELVRKGRRILYTSCALLVQELLIAKRDLTLSRALKRLAVYDGLLIDDLGYVQQSREEMEVLFTLLAERYERGSVLITSNLPFSKWESIFKDPMTTAAATDRLVHHSVILELNLPSYRIAEARAAKQANTGGIQEPATALRDVAGPIEDLSRGGE
jgi:DNA replication protein DnaC